jgi:hypothetical protein
VSDSIFLVTGQCGEYSDRSEWIVCWFPTEAEAVAYAELCRSQYLALTEDDKHELRWQDPNTFRSKVAADPYFTTDYTGTTYDVQQCERGPVSK